MRADSGQPSLFEWLDREPGVSSELLIWLPPDDLASEVMEGFHLPCDATGVPTE